MNRKTYTGTTSTRCRGYTITTRRHTVDPDKWVTEVTTDDDPKPRFRIAGVDRFALLNRAIYWIEDQTIRKSSPVTTSSH